MEGRHGLLHSSSILAIVTILLFYLRSTRSDSGFLVTAPQRFVSGSTERVCATFSELQGHVIRLSLLDRRQGNRVLAEVSKATFEENMCLDIEVPDIGSHGSQEVWLEAEVSGRSSVSGIPFSDTQAKKVLLYKNANMVQTYVQTDKPIYKAGQTVKFRILSLSYPDLKPHTKKIRSVYVQEPGGRRVQQWSSVETQSGLADMEMPLSPEPPLGNWTIFVVLHGNKKKTMQTFEVGEYVLPKFGVTIKPHSSYIYRDAETVTVEICAEYSYGEPVKGSIEANFTLIPEVSWVPKRPIITQLIDDTGSDGCHTFRIDAASLEIEQVFEDYTTIYFTLHVAAAFTEQGTDVTMTEVSDNVASLERDLYTLAIEGSDGFKPGLPYHGMVRLTYPDNFPVSNVQVQVILRNFEGGESFTETVTTTVNNGVGTFVVTPPRSADNTRMKLEASIVEDESQFGINAVKYLQAWFSPSGSFLLVTQMDRTKQDGQQDNIDVDFTLPASYQETITFHYKIMSRGNVVQSGVQEWAEESITPPVVNIPIAPLPRNLPDENPLPPNQERVIPRFQQAPPIFSLSLPERGRQKRRSVPRPYPGIPGPQSRVEEPHLPDYFPARVARVSIPFTVSSKMAPRSKVIVYYIRSDGEVVSGSGQFSVANVFENQVSLDFSEQEAQPGAPVQLTVRAAPQSLCAVGIVDKSVHLLRDSNQLTANKVKAPLQSFGTYSGRPINPSSHCSSIKTRKQQQMTQFSKHLDTTEAFKNAGMVLITNLDVDNRLCYTRVETIQRYPYYSHCAFCRGGVPGMPGPDNGDFGRMVPRGPGGPMGRPGPMDRDVMMVPMAMDIDIDMDGPMTDTLSNEEETNSFEPLVELRSYFPETWLWYLGTTGETGSANITSEVPHTITDWVANGFCTSVDRGFGIAEPTKLRAFQPFFLSYNLPYSAIREEKIPIDVTVFNYLTECFTVELSIEESNEFSLVNASPIQYVCVCDRESKTVNYTIIPRTIGDVKITVRGRYVTPGFNVPFCGNNVFLPTVEGVRDAVEDTLLVEPEGVEREETYSEMVCLEDGEEFNAVVPLSLPTDVIKDSARGTVFVTGDLMGSVLSNLESILAMPTGCGEQNMIKFAPNIYVLQYLTRTNQLTKEIEDKALGFLRIGYQRELMYRLDDASYSAFGQSDGEGSTWLTAFVLKSYVQANAYIDIDTNDIVKTRKWLLDMQNKRTGCFRNSGVLRHKSMKGGVSDEVTLTAYVLIALLESGVALDDSRVTLAEQCISARLTNTNDDPYAMALVSYALLMALNPDGQIGLQQLETMAITESGGVKYWKRTEDEIVPDDCAFNSPPSAFVEMTSYALLAYLVSEEKSIADAFPIVRWLNQQRSALGGYSTTQDTIMGLQSLSQYSGEVYRNDTNMAIDISKSGEVFLGRVIINAENKILLQRKELDEVPTTLTFDARGKGCALVQARSRYNIPTVRNIRRDPFEIELDMSPSDDKQHCGTKTISTCIRYVGTREATSMAAVEFKMVTGYEVNMEHLMMFMQKNGRAIGLKRVDQPKKGSPLVLYFDQFDRTQRCFDVEVKQGVIVEGAKPASIKVYDYYEPGVKSYKAYNPCPPKEEEESIVP